MTEIGFAVGCVALVLYHAFFVWPPDWRDDWIKWVRSLPEIDRKDMTP